MQLELNEITKIYFPLIPQQGNTRLGGKRSDESHWREPAAAQKLDVFVCIEDIKQSVLFFGNASKGRGNGKCRSSKRRCIMASVSHEVAATCSTRKQ